MVIRFIYLLLLIFALSSQISCSKAKKSYLFWDYVSEINGVVFESSTTAKHYAEGDITFGNPYNLLILIEPARSEIKEVDVEIRNLNGSIIYSQENIKIKDYVGRDGVAFQSIREKGLELRYIEMIMKARFFDENDIQIYEIEHPLKPKFQTIYESDWWSRTKSI